MPTCVINSCKNRSEILKKYIEYRFTAKCFKSRRKDVMLFAVVLSAIVATLPTCWTLAKAVANVLMLPESPEPEVTHFFRNRDLWHYLNEIGEPIVQPTDTACETLSSINLLIMVASCPQHDNRREFIRKTWSSSQPTFFVMGLRSHGLTGELQMATNKIEAKMYNDIILFDFMDHYQNLTLKTALMLQWVSRSCPQAVTVLKTDEDVLVNPWTLREVMKDHSESQIIGFSINNTRLHRDPYNKYYVPHRLIRDNWIDQYLSGTGYLVKGRYVKEILKSAGNVPLANVEDVYITYMVAKRSLNLTLTHDSRLNPSRPLFPFVCSYWNRAIIHNMKPEALNIIWEGLKRMSKYRFKYKNICNASNLFDRDLSVFWHLLYY